MQSITGRVFSVDPKYISDPESSEFITIFRNQLDGKYYGRRSDGTDELLAQDVPVNVGNTIYVDSVYGDNTAAVEGGIYDQRYPFLTIFGALAQASAGDIIYVRKGTYSQGTISNPVADFYLEAGAIVQNLSSPDVFLKSDGGTLNIYGEGTLRNIVYNAYIIACLNSSTINIQANLLQKTSTNFGGALIALTGGKINAWIKEIDCSYDYVYACECLDANSRITLNADKVRFSFICYLLSGSANGPIIANVKETISHQMVSSNSFGNTFAGIINNVSANPTIILNGNCSTANTSDVPHSLSRVLSVHNSSANGKIIHNGGSSVIRNIAYAGISSGANSTISFNADVENLQGATQTGYGVYINSGKIFCKGKLKNLNYVGSTIQVDGGSLILDDLTYVSNVGATDSISASAPINIKVYKSVTNKPWNVNITNTIVGSLNIVDAGVE